MQHALNKLTFLRQIHKTNHGYHMNTFFLQKPTQNEDKVNIIIETRFEIRR